MLTRLVIQDVVLIDRLSVPFKAGLNGFTGETGAGKSILLDALALALGARSDAGLIRAGATQASVTAEFTVPAPSSALASLLEEQGLLIEEPLTLRRTITKEGKSRAFLCDQPIGVTLLKQIGQHLLEVHGQFETHGLLNPSTHGALLDSYADAETLADKTAEAFARWKRAQASLDEAQKMSHQAKAEEDFLRETLKELTAAAPEEGEYETLLEKKAQLGNRDKILEGLSVADNLLTNDRGALIALSQAAKTLVRLSDKMPALADVVAMMDRASSEAAEASDKVARLIQSIEADASSLEKIEDRLYKLRGLARKHNTTPENLVALMEDTQRRVDLISGQGDQVEALARAVGVARQEYMKNAEALSAQRGKAAKNLSSHVEKELAPLKLEKARFIVACETLPESQWSADGMDQVVFLAATNAGASPSPLHKVASGGELARFMLAIKVVLSKAAPVPTLVFDEVDAGIGGATAFAVGERLAVLARDVQVLVVTHSPQIAARCGHHLRVRKQEKGKFPTTLVDMLEDGERVEEIARMLAGSQVTDAARQAAQALMDGETAEEQKPMKRKAAR